MTSENVSAGKAALAAAARAFDRAKRDGNVWLGDDGLFQTFEMFDDWTPAAPKNPDQLRLCG
jgi:hypothetical protein